MRSVIMKVVWAGRAASLFVGLAVMVGLLFGLASAAFGANGDNFILGSLENKATTVSRLVGNVAGGPALQINNNSAAAGSRALQIGVAEGKAPLTVNARAGKATNLDADKVDGKEAADFLGKNEKVADSDRLDGQDSSAFAGFGESTYAVGGAVTPCATVELASISNVSVSRPSRIYASGTMVYFPGQASTSLKYGEVTIELRDSSNNTVASSGKMYGSTTGAEDIPLSLQGVLMSGSNPHASSSPFVAQPGANYTLRFMGRSSSGHCDNNNPPYMKDRVLSYLLIGATK